jgi:N-acetylmuramoyl-L-alanine amidase
MKIAIDPGHGMSNARPNTPDPGATARVGNQTFEEDDIVLGYGQTLRRLFEENGIEVFMTRNSSTEPAPVGTRARRARDADCDVFVSLHLNANDDPQANGLEVLFRDPAKDGPLAERLQRELLGVTGFRDRGTRRRTDLAVLRFSRGPAVLIELGFISNARDRNFVLNAANRDAVCRSIFDVLANTN